MRWIDRFAYNNAIRKLDPAYKAGFSLAVIGISLICDLPIVSLTLLCVVLGVSFFWARLPFSFVFRLLFTEGAFLAFGVLGVVVSISTSPIPQGLSIGPFWLNATLTSLLLGGRLLSRSLACASAMNFLSLTTPLIDLIDLLRRLHVPNLLIDLMSLIYRFIFTLLDCLDRMVLSQEIRLGFDGWKKSLRSAGQIGANLFIEAYRKSQKLEISLQGRGWSDTLNVLPQEYEALEWPWQGRSRTKKRG